MATKKKPAAKPVKASKPVKKATRVVAKKKAATTKRRAASKVEAKQKGFDFTESSRLAKVPADYKHVRDNYESLADAVAPVGFAARVAQLPSAVKHKPTAEQQEILDLAPSIIASKQVLMMEAGAGCLAGDTILHLNRARKGFRADIKHVVKMHNGGRANGRVWRSSIPTFVARAVDGVITLGLLKEAWFSGNKETFTIKTASGLRIRATEIHPFLTPNGWKRLKQLHVKDEVCINVGRSTTGRQAEFSYAMTDTKYHPYQIPNGGDRYKVATHRLVVESALNGLSMREYVDLLRTDVKGCLALTFLLPGQIVHHKDENSLNNRLDNLEVVFGQGEHGENHEWGRNVLWQVGTDRIVSIEQYGVEPTYDIEVEDDPHNFIANGFVVHNTGKTSSLKMLADVLPGRGQYTAFNKAPVDDNKVKFQGTRVNCDTTHRLAFLAVGKKYAHRLGGQRVRSEQVGNMLGIKQMTIITDEKDPKVSKKVLAVGMLAANMMQAIRRYCQSAEKTIDVSHFQYIDGIDNPSADGRRTYDNNIKVREYLLPFAHKAWTDLIDEQGQLPFQHDHYVKIWQLNNPVVSGDYGLLDEAQDTAPVMLDIVRQQVERGMPWFIVGDSAQQIYSWRGAVNALAAFPNAPRKFLSQSFRFGEAIAKVANKVLSTLQEKTPLRLKGLKSIPSKVCAIVNPTAILCRTNAMAIGYLLSKLSEGKKPFLVGGGSDVISFVKAAEELQQGRATNHPDLSCFTTWGEVQEYAKQDEGEDLQLMVKLIDSFGARAIINALTSMPQESDADLVISTAHKSKGREWERVKLACDFPTVSKSKDEDKRLLYVAATRAKLELDITECPFFTGEDSLEIGDIFAEQSQNYESADPSLLPPAPSTPPKPTEFTWSKGSNGNWSVRGPVGFAGKLVSVKRKNGSSSDERLAEPTWEGDGVAIYPLA